MAEARSPRVGSTSMRSPHVTSLSLLARPVRSRRLFVGWGLCASRCVVDQSLDDRKVGDWVSGADE